MCSMINVEASSFLFNDWAKSSERHSISLALGPSLIFIFRDGPKCLGSALALAIGEMFDY